MTAPDRTFTATWQKIPGKGGRTCAVTVHLDERLSPTPRRTTR
jgi:hypothetical protein